MKAAAEILREDMRSQGCEMDLYPSTDCDLGDPGTLPETLQAFLEVTITSKSETGDTVRRRRAGIGQALMSACRPKSFISPILLSLGVYAHRNFESKDLIEKLSAIGFSVGYEEVKRYQPAAVKIIKI